MGGQSSSRKGLFFCHTNFSLYCLAQTGCCHLSSQLWQPEEVPTRVSVTPEWPRPIFLGSAQPLPGWFPGTATCSYLGEGQAWPFVSGHPAYSSGSAFYSARGKGDPARWHNLWMPIDLDWRPKTQDEAFYENPGAGKPHWSWHGSCIFGRFKSDLVVLLLSLVYV